MHQRIILFLRKKSMTLTLTKHNAFSLSSLVLGLLYSYYIIYWHEVYVEMAVHKLEDIGLDAFNMVVMKVVLGISGLLCIFIAWRLRWQYKHQRRPQIILHGLLAFALLIGLWMTTHTLFFLEMNVELVHVPMYAILAFFLYFAFRHWTMVVLVALPIMLYDEWYQYIVLHAHYETYYSFNDVMCDVLGLAVGLLLLAILGFYPKRRRLHFVEWIYLAAFSLSGLYFAWLWHKGYLIGYQADRLLHTRFVFNQLLNPAQLWQIHSYTFKEYMVFKPIMGVSIVLGSCIALCFAGLFFRERSI